MSDASEPARFPPELLEQPLGARQAYFEREVLVRHPRLVEVVRQTLSAVCYAEASESSVDALTPVVDQFCVGKLEYPLVFRDPLMVLVAGPSRVGKTTGIALMETELSRRTDAVTVANPNDIPFVSVNARGSNTGRFDWGQWYKSILRALNDPFLQEAARNPTFDRERNYEAAMVEALRLRHTRVIIVDEAHNLAQARTGSALDSHLRYLKGIEQAAHVSHIFVGTYAMRPFRTVDEQVSLRTRDVHFARYDAKRAEDKEAFASTLWAFQMQLPLRTTPPLVEHYWEYLHERSLGCIGLLKTHLNRALELALQEDEDTITETHLRQAQMPADKLARARYVIELGEKELTDAGSVAEAYEKLMRDLFPVGAAIPGRVQVAAPETPTPTPRRQSGARGKQSGGALPGDRRPGRDALGPPDTSGHGVEVAG